MVNCGNVFVYKKWIIKINFALLIKLKMACALSFLDGKQCLVVVVRKLADYVYKN